MQGEGLRASQFEVRSENLGVVWVRMGFKNHLVPWAGINPKGVGYKPSVSTGKCGGLYQDSLEATVIKTLFLLFPEILASLQFGDRGL